MNSEGIISRQLKLAVYRASQHHLLLEKLSAKAELISASPYLERYSIVSTAIFKGNLVMHALTQSNVNKAHVVLQSLRNAPANIPLTGVINTKTPKMTQKQKVASYLKSVEGNPNTDAYKIRAREASSTANNKRNPNDLSMQSDALDLAPARHPNYFNCQSRDDGGTSLKRELTERSAASGSDNQWRDAGWDAQYLYWAFKKVVVPDINENIHAPFAQIIGPEPHCPGTQYPLIIDPSIVDEADKNYIFFDLSYHLSMQHPPRIIASKPSEIDDFLRNPPDPNNKIVYAAPEVIEAWGTRSQFRQEQNMTAFAIRRKDWAMFKYGYPTIGAAVGLLAVGAILVKCRKRVTDSASNVKQSIQRCFGSSEAESAEDQDHTTNVNPAVIDIDGHDAESRSPSLGDFSSSVEEVEELQAIVITAKPSTEVIVDGSPGDETSEVV